MELETDELRALKDHPGLTPVDFTDGPYYNFTRSQIIAPGVRMIPAPGHTYGNCIVIAEDGGINSIKREKQEGGCSTGSPLLCVLC